MKKIEKIEDNQQGITLIALVVTIIVLLILAGVALSTINGGDGIMDKAKKAVEETKNSDELSGIQLAVTSAVLDTAQTRTGLSKSKLQQELSKTIGKEVTLTTEADGWSFEGERGTYIIKSDGSVEQTSVYNGGNSSSSTPTQDPGSTPPSYIGKYADINGDGTVDGIIYVDLLEQAGQEGQWGSDENATFRIPTGVTSSNVKKYTMSTDKTTDTRFDSVAREVVQLDRTQSGVKERFYVMALTDMTNTFDPNNKFSWYKNARGVMTDYETTTSVAFGTGRENTAAIKAKRNLRTGDTGYYGAPYSTDLWGYIPTTPKVNSNASETNRWFIPSRGEWAAFAQNLSVSILNLYNLSETYFTSSQSNAEQAWCIPILVGQMLNGYSNESWNVRASTTF